MAIKKKASKKAAPKKRITKKVVREDLKGKGLKLPHGYEVKRRTITGVMNEGKKMILRDIGNLESKKFAATAKREKNQISKQISLLKRSYRKLT